MPERQSAAQATHPAVRVIPPGVSGSQLGADGKFRKHRYSECQEIGHNRRNCPRLRAKREAAGKSPTCPVRAATTKAKATRTRTASEILLEAEKALEAEVQEMGALVVQIRALRLRLTEKGRP